MCGPRNITEVCALPMVLLHMLPPAFRLSQLLWLKTLCLSSRQVHCVSGDCRADAKPILGLKCGALFNDWHFFFYIGTEKENANPGWASLHRQLPLLGGIGVPFVFGFGWGRGGLFPKSCCMYSW